VLSEELLILASCLLRPIGRNSVLEEFSESQRFGLLLPMSHVHVLLV